MPGTSGPQRTLIPKLGAQDPAGAWSEEGDADSQQMPVSVAFHGNQQINPVTEFLLPSSSPKSKCFAKKIFKRKKKEKEFAMLPNEVMLKA